MKPLAIDLFCGLGGWTEGLLAEGYAWYDSIWHTRHVRSRIDSGKRSIRLASAGLGLPQNIHLDTAFSSPTKATRQRARTASLTGSRLAKYLTDFKCFTIATIVRACVPNIYLSERNSTTCEICDQKGGGPINAGIIAGRKTRTLFSLTRRLRPCWPTLRVARGL